MSLSEWRSNGWLRPHRTSAEEITGLFSIVDRDLQDARTSDLSTDWQFGIAYNASLKLCMVLLQASGYRAEKTLQHSQFNSPLALHDIIEKMRFD